MHFKYENLKNYAPSNIAYCASARLGVPLLFGANFIMENIEYYKNLSLENLTCYDDDGNFHVEKWKDIDGYENVYQISTFGRVKSLSRIHIGRATKLKVFTKEKILRLKKTKYGYIHVALSRNNKLKHYSIHRRVAIAFIPNPDNKPEVNHKKSIKTDNRFFELEWMTVSENQAHYQLTQPKSSKYTGVYKHENKWQARILFNNKSYHLGTFNTEIEAYYAYQNASKQIKENTFVIPKQIKNNTYKWITYSKESNKWLVRITINSERIYVGRFDTEDEAVIARDLKFKEIQKFDT